MYNACHSIANAIAIGIAHALQWAQFLPVYGLVI
jgi:hypothetical protein